MLAHPAFRHHPDPIGSGSLVPSPVPCGCCGRARGLAYSGPVYGEGEAPAALCPWCIADGAAHARLGLSFVDVEAIEGPALPQVERLLTQRTPGFHAWQAERWLACCGEPAAFLAPLGWADLQAGFPRLEGPLLAHAVHDLGVSGGAAQRLLQALRRDQPPTAFAFQCLCCEGRPVYIDGL